MSRYVFVPLTDEILYEHPELINGPVVPYRADRACYRWLSVELNPVDEPLRTQPLRPNPRRRDKVIDLVRPRLAAHSH